MSDERNPSKTQRKIQTTWKGRLRKKRFRSSDVNAMMEIYLEQMNVLINEAIVNKLQEYDSTRDLSLRAVSQTVRAIFHELTISEKNIQEILDPVHRARQYQKMQGDDLLRQILAEQIDIHLSIKSLEETLIAYDENRKKDSHYVAVEVMDAMKIVWQRRDLEISRDTEKFMSRYNNTIKEDLKEQLWSSTMMKWVPIGLLGILNVILAVLILTIK